MLMTRVLYLFGTPPSVSTYEATWVFTWGGIGGG
jgi:hypothetical protein